MWIPNDVLSTGSPFFETQSGFKRRHSGTALVSMQINRGCFCSIGKASKIDSLHHDDPHFEYGADGLPDWQRALS